MKALIVGMFAASLVSTAQTAPKLAGTYSIRICSATCASSDSTMDLASGYMVLDDKPIEIGEFPFLARYRIRQKSRGLLYDERANACFSLRKPYRPRIMAGIVPEALSLWQIRHDTLWVRLFASPDAGYSFRAILGKGKLGGIGHEYAAFGGGSNRDDEFTEVTRVGPPDISKCFPRNIVEQYNSSPEPTDDDYKIHALLDLRDRAENSGDTTLIRNVYAAGSLISDEHRESFYGVDSIAVAKLKASRQLRLHPRTSTRANPRLVTKNFAYIEEYFQVTNPIARGSVAKKGTRISIAERLGDQWFITRELTFVEAP